MNTGVESSYADTEYQKYKFILRRYVMLPPRYAAKNNSCFLPL